MCACGRDDAREFSMSQAAAVEAGNRAEGLSSCSRLAVVTVSRNARLHGLRCSMSALAMLRSCSRRVSADRGAAV